MACTSSNRVPLDNGGPADAPTVDFSVFIFERMYLIRLHVASQQTCSTSNFGMQRKNMELQNGKIILHQQF